MGARGAARLLPDGALAQADRLLGRDDGRGRGAAPRASASVFRGPSEPAPADAWERFAAALDDDFNTPAALAVMHEWRRPRRCCAAALDVFGLESLADGDEAPAEVVALAEQRDEARAARDFAEADRLRDEIEAAGWEVRDDADGFRLVRRR